MCTLANSLYRPSHLPDRMVDLPAAFTSFSPNRGIKRTGDPQPVVPPRPLLPQPHWTLVEQAALDRSIGGGESAFVHAPYILQYICTALDPSSRQRLRPMLMFMPMTMSISIPTPHPNPSQYPLFLPPSLPKESSVCRPQPTPKLPTTNHPPTDRHHPSTSPLPPYPP